MPSTALDRPDADDWVAAINKEYDAFFEFEALEVVNRLDVPEDAEVYGSLMSFTVKRSGLRKNRWCLDGSDVHRADALRAEGLPDSADDAPFSTTATSRVYSSPCADSVCVMMFASLCVAYGYTPCAGDISKRTPSRSSTTAT
mmetsp:Transcript_31024/g.100000  ORF Transcript_31024/g.100000 Transcript_31024/m.100000 type:complete len:143 (-) Transcript_31024:1713-2141(-)